eukprot:Skav204159  [mRNA]  locus=scaffold903:316394:316654:+ [translate_table: standard]
MAGALVGNCSVDLSVPPGGQTIILMDPQHCIQSTPKLKVIQKPGCLPMVDDATWNDWMEKLCLIVKSYWDEMLGIRIEVLALTGAA